MSATRSIHVATLYVHGSRAARRVLVAEWRAARDECPDQAGALPMPY